MSQRRILSLFLCLVVVFQLVGYIPVFAEKPTDQPETTELNATNPFKDVSASDWFYDSVMTAYEKGLFKGTSGNEFSPYTGMTRAMFVTVLARLEGIDESKYTGSNYSDVVEGTWYAPSVKWASEKGIVNGYGNNRFGTEDNITREQMATLLGRYLATYGYMLKDESNANPDYSDLSDVSEWARSSVNIVWVSGIFQGDDKGNFNPQNTAKRSEGAAVYVRLLSVINPNITHREETETAKIKDSVTIIDSEPDILNYAETDTGFVFMIQNADPRIRNLSTGEVFVLPATNDFPAGASGVVEGIQIDGDITSLSFRVPEIGDVFSEIDIAKNTDVLSAESLEVYQIGENTSTINTFASGDIKFEKNAERIKVELVAYEMKGGEGEKLTLSGKLELYNPELYTDIKYSLWNGLENFAVVLTETCDAAIDVSGEVKAEKKLQIYEMLVQVAVIPVGPIPVPVFAHVSINLHISVTGKVTVELSCSMQQQVGAYYNNSSGLLPVNINKVDLNPLSIKTEAKFDVTLNPEVFLNTLLIDIYGVEGDVGKGIKWNNEIQNCTYCVAFGTYYISEVSTAYGEIFKDIPSIEIKLDFASDNIDRYIYVSSNPIGIYWDKCPHGNEGGSEDDNNDWDTSNPRLDSTTYEIYTASELAWIAAQTNSGANNFSGYTVKLMNDIDLKNKNWIPIGNSENAFCGTFDGNNKAISNLYINTSSIVGAGLFGYIENAIIKNVLIKSVNITGTSVVGGLIAYSNASKVIDCSIQNGITINANKFVGGVVGYCCDSSVESIEVKGNIAINGKYQVGGLFGTVLGCHSIYVGTVDGDITVMGEETTGGIVGYFFGGALRDYILNGNISVSGSTYVGGLIGYLRASLVDPSAIGNNSINGSLTVSGVEFVGNSCGYNFLGVLIDNTINGNVIED